MSDSVELRTIDKCTSQLETALAAAGIERSIVHFLKDECFISNEVREKILDPSSLSESEKAWELVRRIVNRVKQDPQSYHTLVNRLKQGGNLYRPIIKKLEEEYARQETQGQLVMIIM